MDYGLLNTLNPAGEVAYCRLNVLRDIRTTHPESISHINGIAIPTEDDYMKYTLTNFSSGPEYILLGD